MKRLALLCLLIAGCGTAHGATVRVRRAKQGAKKPVQTKTAAVRDLAPVSSKDEAVPAAASNPIVDAVEKAEQKRVSRFRQEIIDRLSEAADPVPIPPPGPVPVPPPPAPPSPPIVEPFLTLPATVDGDVGDYIEIKPQTNCKAVHWLTIDKGLKRFPDSALSDPTMTVVSALVPGQYRLAAFAASGDEPVGPVEVMVVVHGPQPPPQPTPIPQPPVPVPQPPPPPPPPPPAPVTQPAKLWIVVVNNSTGVDPVTAKLLGDVSFWNAVRAHGHEFRNYNSTQPEYAKYRSIVAANGGVPCLILLDATKVDSTGVAPWLNKSPGESGIPLGGSVSVKALINKYTSRPVP